MVDIKTTKKFLEELLQEFENDDVAIIFMAASIIGYAKEMAEADPNLVYQGFIPGLKWKNVALRILEKRH